ncbi:MAG: FtsQ-type protein [Frankiales bacterium]|nr:FtsQ-type protein [Frankiales bacterium]
MNSGNRGDTATRPTRSGSVGPTSKAGMAPKAGGRMSSTRLRVGAVLLVLVVVIAAWVVGFSSVFGVGTVQVTGVSGELATAVRTGAAVPNGFPLARLDTAAIAARVGAIEQVRSVRVEKAYPTTVRIVVQPRVAVGYRAAASGSPTVRLVDSANVGFENAPSAPGRLPELTMPAGTATPAAGAAATATVAGALTPGVARQVARISAATTESVTLTLRDGRTVFWGGLDRNGDKAKLLTALLGQPGQYFDISDPDAVVSRSG